MMKVFYIFILVLLTPLQAFADDIMKGLFEDNLRINQSSAGRSDNNSSYGYAFGSTSVRIRHMNAQFGTFTPPSLSTGCSGIDFFGGSFSLMSKDELVQIGRAIIQGAGSYAFGLALDSICPSCNAEMKALKKQLDLANSYLTDSCSASEALLRSDALGNWATNMEAKTAEEAALAEKEGLYTDRFAGWVKNKFNKPNKDSKKSIKDLVSDNWLNEALSRFNDDWLNGYGFTKEESKGFVLAIMGSSIHRLEEPEEEDMADGKAVPLAPLFGMQDFINGRPDEENLTIYKCKAFDDFPADKCLDVEEKTTSMKSLEDYHYTKIAGTAAKNWEDGLGWKFYNYQKTGEAKPSEDDWAYMKSFSMDIIEMFEIMGNNDQLIQGLSRWLARTQAIKQGYALLTRLSQQLMKLTHADYSDRQGMLAKVRFFVPKRLAELRLELSTLNEIETANKVSIGVAVNQYKELRIKILKRNAKMLSSE